MVSHSDGDHVDGIAEALKDVDNISLMVDYGGVGSGNVLATKFIKSGGTSSQFLKADGSVDSNKYLINSNSSYTTSYARGININGSNWTFWSPVNSSTSGTVYGPTNAGTKD
jgi:hypothetical protein